MFCPPHFENRVAGPEERNSSNTKQIPMNHRYIDISFLTNFMTISNSICPCFSQFEFILFPTGENITHELPIEIKYLSMVSAPPSDAG